MAENEILDLVRPRTYQRWRAALADPECAVEETAQCLADSVCQAVKKQLRGNPIYEVLKSCGRDPAALRAAIDTFKDRELARLVRQAYRLTSSTDPARLMHTVAQLIIDQIRDRACVEAMKQEHLRDQGKFSELKQATAARLDACRSTLVDLLMDEPVRLRPPRTSAARPSAKAVAGRSLRVLSGKRPEKPAHV